MEIFSIQSPTTGVYPHHLMEKDLTNEQSVQSQVTTDEDSHLKDHLPRAPFERVKRFDVA